MRRESGDADTRGGGIGNGKGVALRYQEEVSKYLLAGMCKMGKETREKKSMGNLTNVDPKADAGDGEGGEGSRMWPKEGGEGERGRGKKRPSTARGEERRVSKGVYKLQANIKSSPAPGNWLLREKNSNEKKYAKVEYQWACRCRSLCGKWNALCASNSLDPTWNSQPPGPRHLQRRRVGANMHPSDWILFKCGSESRRKTKISRQLARCRPESNQRMPIIQ